MATRKRVIFRRALLAAALAMLAVGISAALAGSGVGGVFNLGQTNTVDAETILNGNAGGNPQLRVQNASGASNAFGVLGRITSGSPAAQSAGLRGINSGTNANGFGVWGFHQGSGVGVFGETGAGIGVLGKHTASTGNAAGVRGETASDNAGAAGVLGTVTAATPAPGSAGVRGTNPAAGGYGVVGESTGFDPGGNSAGVFGRGSRVGILGEGVRAGASLFSRGTALYACTAPDDAPEPCSPSPISSGVGGEFRAKNADGIGVFGCAGGSCSLTVTGAIGGQFKGVGAFATGVLASASGGSDTIGITGLASGSGAIGGLFDADGSSAIGVLAYNPNGLAGKFEGELHTIGRITKAYTSGTSSEAVPIAYGTVSNSGVLLSGTPNVSSTYDSVNRRYVVTIANETYTTTAYTTSVTPTTAAQPRFATTSSAGGNLFVRIFDHNGGLQQAQFSFITYKA